MEEPTKEEILARLKEKGALIGAKLEFPSDMTYAFVNVYYGRDTEKPDYLTKNNEEITDEINKIDEMIIIQKVREKYEKVNGLSVEEAIEIYMGDVEQYGRHRF